jgi:hypothetical protein
MATQHEGCNGCCPGPMGPQGPVGPQGPQGIEGKQGPSGLNGKDGKDGMDGAPGSQGKDGQMGPTGPQGPMGLQGMPGVNGKDGIDGKDGKDGKDGMQGIQGMQGLQGPKGDQGQQGPKGDCIECPCDCNNSIEFAEVFSKVTQTLSASPGTNLPGQTVLLENTIFATSNIDVSNAAVNGKIIVNLAGWYDVATGICGFRNSIESPLPCWTLSLFKNGVYVPGSTFANQTISPEQKSNEIVADVFVHFDKGDVLELANTSNDIVNMAAATLGTNAPASSAYMKIVLLKAD